MRLYYIFKVSLTILHSIVHTFGRIHVFNEINKYALMFCKYKRKPLPLTYFGKYNLIEGNLISIWFCWCFIIDDIKLMKHNFEDINMINRTIYVCLYMVYATWEHAHLASRFEIRHTILEWSTHCLHHIAYYFLCKTWYLGQYHIDTWHVIWRKCFRVIAWYTNMVRINNDFLIKWYKRKLRSLYYML